VDYIRDQYEVEGKSMRQIAKEVGKSFRTVAKYVKQEDFSPKTGSAKAERPTVLEGYTATIDEWLTQDKREPRKQRHTAKRVYDRLKAEKGYPYGYGAVKRYVAKKRLTEQQNPEGYLPIEQRMGEAQTDFGQFKYNAEGGEGEKGYYLIVSFPYSNAGWAQVFPSQNQECLLEGLKRIFAHVGGAPIRLRCDNMTTAVVSVQEGGKRELAEGFLRFKMHYRFETDFCNLSRGNEKGNVENKVGYTRRNLFVPAPVINDMAQYNQVLLERCDKDHDRPHYMKQRTIAELFYEEKAKLLALPRHEYEVYRYEGHRVTKTGFITIETNRYALAPEYAGKVVQTKIYYDHIEVYYERTHIKTYERSYGRSQEIVDWKQYLGTLVKKPGGVEHTRFFNQMPKLWQEHLKKTSGQERKTALMLLSQIVSEGNEHLCEEAVEMAEVSGRLDNDNILACYLFITRRETEPPPLSLTSNPPVMNYKPDLSAYDGLLGGSI
jgi:transposase